ncbi:hypothetical protein [Halorussus gelatinilyticus]|nr:hypothetical protein [Halorussus gelatinilyticus]
MYDSADEAWGDIVSKTPKFEHAKRTARRLPDHWCWRVRYDE